jgi:hypothetical protein
LAQGDRLQSFRIDAILRTVLSPNGPVETELQRACALQRPICRRDDAGRSPSLRRNEAGSRHEACT